MPGNRKVLDVLQINKDNTGFGDKLVVLSRRDSNMFYHVVNPRTAYDNAVCKIHEESEDEDKGSK